MKTKINKNNVKRLKALLKKGEPLPYKNLATIFAEHATDPEESEDSLCNKSIKKGLLAFGDYLEEKKVIMPLKIDVIDFVLKNQSKKPDVLCWYFWGCMKFMMFCHAHSDDIFDGIFKNTDVYREVKFLSAVIFDYDYTGFKSDEEDE